MQSLHQFSTDMPLVLLFVKIQMLLLLLVYILVITQSILIVGLNFIRRLVMHLQLEIGIVKEYRFLSLTLMAIKK